VGYCPLASKQSAPLAHRSLITVADTIDILEVRDTPKAGDVIAVWFSCGAASAVALKKTIERYPDCTILALNNYIKEEDKDNRRFLRDVSEWVGLEIQDVRNPLYPNGSCVEVWENRKFMSGVKGAPCTMELKFNARLKWEKKNKTDWTVMGFTADEVSRYTDLKERIPNLLPGLIDDGFTKGDCFNEVTRAGIALPNSYLKGYPNANCPGCVKATSPTYWNHVRKVDPDIFAARAEQSRRIGAKLVRVKNVRIFLDELDPSATGKPMKDMNYECGVTCPSED